MKHANLSVFVPHAGCRHTCSFCSQKEISGAQSPPRGENVTALCTEHAAYLQSKGFEAEVAFFGGSFTAINREYMLELLEAAFPFVQSGAFTGIRVSTRPDCVDQEVLQLLKHYGVNAVELGAQSMDDAVLEANRRGHSSDNVVKASALVKDAGLSLGLQMMTGLYGADRQSDMETVCRLAKLQPDTVRIYPTVVLEGTELAQLYQSGRYQPMDLESAVDLGAWALDYFDRQGIAVIRMGLHAQESMEAARIAGPYHPAFRELCEGRLMARQIASVLQGKPAGQYLAYVAGKSISKICGHGGFGVEYLARLGYNVTIRQDRELSGLEFRMGEV